MIEILVLPVLAAFSCYQSVSGGLRVYLSDASTSVRLGYLTGRIAIPFNLNIIITLQRR